MADFVELGAQVVVVSTQSVKCHRLFADRHGLDFTLIADEDKRVSRLCGALGMLGLNRRVTYIIERDGTIAGVYRSETRPRSHVEWAREQLDALA